MSHSCKFPFNCEITILPFPLGFSGLVCVIGMVGVVTDAIGCVSRDFDHLELRILGRVDFGQYYEFRASDMNFINSIAFKTLSLS